LQLDPSLDFWEEKQTHAGRRLAAGGRVRRTVAGSSAAGAVESQTVTLAAGPLELLAPLATAAGRQPPSA